MTNINAELNLTAEETLESMFSALDEASSGGDSLAKSKLPELDLMEAELASLGNLESLSLELDLDTSVDLNTLSVEPESEVLEVKKEELELVIEALIDETEVENKPENDIESALEAISEMYCDEEINEAAIVEPEVLLEPEPEPKKKTEKTKSEGVKKPKARFVIEEISPEECKRVGLSKETLLERYEASPKKAKEKIINLIQWSRGEAELSVYTIISLSSLIKNNTVSSETLRISMMSNPDRPYPTATAGTQAGQMMAALPAVGFADRIAKNMTLNKASPLLSLFNEQYGA